MKSLHNTQKVSYTPPSILSAAFKGTFSVPTKLPSATPVSG